MLLETDKIYFEEQEYEVQSIPEDVKARIIEEQPAMANFIWDTPIPEEPNESDRV